MSPSRLVLPRQFQSIGRARRLLADQFAVWGLEEDDVGFGAVEDLRLVTSELITNAIKFSTGGVGLAVAAHRKRLEVAVTDDSAAEVRLAAPERHDLGGRGMVLVAALTRTWGQDLQVAGGKTVWARVDLAAGSALGRSCDL